MHARMRNYSKFNQDCFLEDFKNFYFEYLDENINYVNAKFNRFLDNLNDIVKKHAPLKKLTKTHHTNATAVLILSSQTGCHWANKD